MFFVYDGCPLQLLSLVNDSTYICKFERAGNRIGNGGN